MKVRGIIGKKIGMTQIFDEVGNVVPVTVLEAGPCLVLQKKSDTGKDGYSAIKIGYQSVEERKLNKPQREEAKQKELQPMRIVREIRMPEAQLEEYEVGAYIKADLFEPGDVVNLTGKSKGRGFAGVMKRHGFGGAKGSHGVHEYFRHGGSVAANSDPSKIWKGKKMPGQYGNVTFTAENMHVVGVDVENNLIMVRGTVPGSRNSVVIIRNSKKKWKRG